MGSKFSRLIRHQIMTLNNDIAMKLLYIEVKLQIT